MCNTLGSLVLVGLPLLLNDYLISSVSVYTKPVNINLLWLATQTWVISTRYLLVCKTKWTHMQAITSQPIFDQIKCIFVLLAIHWIGLWYILKQLFTSVSVNSGGYCYFYWCQILAFSFWGTIWVCSESHNGINNSDFYWLRISDLSTLALMWFKENTSACFLVIIQITQCKINGLWHAEGWTRKLTSPHYSTAHPVKEYTVRQDLVLTKVTSALLY